MAELQKNTGKPYKVCFLGYSKLGEVAREVIDNLPDSDVEYILMESDLENQDICVEEARQLGCRVFVAGPGNAARFSTHYDDPLVEITIRYIDYAIAIRKALNKGCRKICIARHRFSPPPDLPMLEELMEIPLRELTFESIAELREQIRNSDCDAVIGATAAAEIAGTLGRTGILVYYGKESIRDACLRAGDRARKLHETRQSREITNAILNNSQFGMIVTDAEGRVKLFNRTAQRFTGIAASQIRGKLLTDFFPNLSIAALLKSEQNRSDSYRLVMGAMMRCVQERITQDRCTIGILITLYPESHNRKKAVQDTPSPARIVCRWEDVIAQSPIMKKAVEQGQNLATLHYPTMILGQPGSGREIFARCMHSASPQAQKPCITIDLATIAPEDAPHILLGYERQDGTVSGLLTAANGGSVILKNVALAKPVVHACLMQALISRHIFRPGMTAPLLLDLMVSTIMTPEEARVIPADLQSCLAICQLELPSLTERQEDIVPLFLRSLSSSAAFHHRSVLSEQMRTLLTFHRWPGQLQELQAVCTRYVIAMSRLEKATPKTQYLLLLQAIGEDTIFREILAQHPALTQRPVVDKEAFLQGILQVKALMKYSNDTLAEKLSVSRTTIWRILQDAAQGGEDV